MCVAVAALAASAAAAAADKLTLSSAEQSIDVTTSLLRKVIHITLKNEGKTSVNSFVHVLSEEGALSMSPLFYTFSHPPFSSQLVAHHYFQFYLLPH